MKRKNENLRVLFLSYYNLNYGMGASASLLDLLMDMPSQICSIIIEPKRIDLPYINVEVPANVERKIIPIPLKKTISVVLYPFLAFFFSLKILCTLRPIVIISMHHPHHPLSLVGHIISTIFRIPHIVDVRDVWRPLKSKLTIVDYLVDGLERFVTKFIKNDLIIFVCSEHKRILEKRSKVIFKRYLVIPNCVSYTILRNINIRRKVSHSRKIKFIYVGRVAAEYALDKIFPLLDELSSLGYEPVLTILGHTEVKIPTKYKVFIKRLPRRETLKMIAESDVGIGPMKSVLTIPRKVVEYLVLKKAIVAGRGAISRDILLRFRNYIIEYSEKTDPRELAQKLLLLLRNNVWKKNYITKRNDELEFLFCKHKVKTILREILKMYKR